MGHRPVVTESVGNLLPTDNLHPSYRHRSLRTQNLMMNRRGTLPDMERVVWDRIHGHFDKHEFDEAVESLVAST